MAAAGFAWQSRLTVDSGLVTGVLLPGVVMTFGIGLTFTPLAAAATTGVERSDAGLVSGLLNSSRQVGGSIGLAALATIAAGQGVAGYGRAFEVAALTLVAAAAATLLLPGPRASTVTARAPRTDQGFLRRSRANGRGSEIKARPFALDRRKNP
ncbi:hypothetical protein [Phytohabitans rumicis]|uniref:Major facilitator superfamily (MFS) profile domain-containing protein n=1 Tax=Phytohabitans rumicis TaxID=1076125 RepID=A0A6V8L4M1_9ACTN|nr:hypothetical protein [Phytohabitans rumicis]GFJ89569.1 hypothetical protein Prum_032110 [Phytohabitans rumicis]